MSYGTNDVWNNKSPDVILTAFDKLLQQMRVQNPKIILIVAKILPLNPDNRG
jgi:hypothetical protein